MILLGSLGGFLFGAWFGLMFTLWLNTDKEEFYGVRGGTRGWPDAWVRDVPLRLVVLREKLMTMPISRNRWHDYVLMVLAAPFVIVLIGLLTPFAFAAELWQSRHRLHPFDSSCGCRACHRLRMEYERGRTHA